MLKKVLIAIAIIGAGFGASALPAAAEGYIGCPADQIRREVTTPLPSGWWQTPYVARLSNTEIAPIGGKTTLICRYGDAGSVMMEQPENQRCEAVRGGFECRARFIVPPIGALALVQASGDISLRQTFQLDLDRGIEASRGADLWYQAVNERRKYLSPMAPARMALGGRRAAGLSGCQSARYSDVSIALSEIGIGTHVCIQTGEGRYSEIRVNGFERNAIQLSYTTWR